MNPDVKTLLSYWQHLNLDSLDEKKKHFKLGSWVIGSVKETIVEFQLNYEYIYDYRNNKPRYLYFYHLT